MRTTFCIALIAAALLCNPAAAQQRGADQRALDAAVVSAISRGDLKHARDLATTAEHWKWINEAQSGGTSTGRTRADVRAEMGPTQACTEAQRSYQLEAGAYKKNYSAIEGKRQAAQAACGSYRY